MAECDFLNYFLHRKKRKTWLGTISGTLSHWSGDIFRSGLSVLKDSGWWALVDERLPADLIATGQFFGSDTNLGYLYILLGHFIARVFRFWVQFLKI